MATEEETKAFLSHFGVLGMHWGQHKAEDLSVSTSSDEDIQKYLDVKGPDLSKKQQAEKLAENKQKFAAKFGPDSKKADGPGFHLTEDQAMAAITGAAFIGLIAYSAIKLKPPPAGSLVTAEKYIKTCHISQLKSWTGLGTGYVKKSSFKQAEYTLPSGHEFTRLSTSLETDFHKATYAVHNSDDFHRYVSAFRHEKSSQATFHKVTFHAKEDIRIPDLKTRLDTLREVMTTPTYTPSHDYVMTQYNSMSGGSWSSTRAQHFFDALDKKGYHAIIDDMDAGVIGQSPLVIFKHSAFTSKSSKVITKEEITKSEMLLREISNRK